MIRPARPQALQASDLPELYEAHFELVWRVLGRLGVPPSALEDATQEVFMVVQRKLPSFEGRSSLRTWLYGIAQRVASEFRRHHQRRSTEPLPEHLRSLAPDPEECARLAEARARLGAFLDSLEEEQRAVFILVELEQLTVPELAQGLGINLNTAYSRLRLARAAFESYLRRQDARERRSP